MNTLLVVLGGVIAAASGQLATWQNYRLSRRREAETRRQDRLEETYTELGLYLSRLAAWSRSRQPLARLVHSAEPVPIPREERWRIETLVGNHGSAEVRQLLEAWMELFRKIERADAVLRTAEEALQESPSLAEEADKEGFAMRDYQKAVDQAAAAIREQMRMELHGQSVATGGTRRPSAGSSPRRRRNDMG
jgi:hypothetical protein